MAESLDDNYARGGFGQSLAFGRRPALLVIDFVQAYLVPGSPLYAGVEAARDGAVALLAAAREARIPVIHTHVTFNEAVATAESSFARYRLSPASRRAHTPSSPRLRRASSRSWAKR